jgi:pyruvate/2-oxoglutarate dehydrogenase complex dihydrolipoamide dehydrogenase (E3) component
MHLAARLSDKAWPNPPSIFPRCVFTHPPVGAVGLDREEAQRAGHDVVVGTADCSDTARALTDEITDGVVRLVVDVGSRQVLGASMFGVRSDDLIQIVTAIMVGGMDIDRAARMVFPFPTLSQALEVAIADARHQLDRSSTEKA